MPHTVIRPRLVGIGVGPGDPDLITIKAVQALCAADAILVPATEASGDGPGRAEQIVVAAAPEVAQAIVRVPFSMADKRGVTTRRREAWQTSADAALTAFAKGARTVAFATVGDPSVYSTFSYLAAYVTEQLGDVQIDVVPGITAMQALAAESRTPLVEGTETLALVPVTAGLETLEKVLDAVDTVVAYKGGRRMPEVAAALAERSRKAVVGINVGLEEQELFGLERLAADRKVGYFSTVIVPAVRDGQETGGRL